MGTSKGNKSGIKIYQKKLKNEISDCDVTWVAAIEICNEIVNGKLVVIWKLRLSYVAG
jgi:hypothetical protein